MSKLWLQRTATVSALAFALSFSAISAGQSEAEKIPAAGEKSYSGMVTCSRCGAKHSMALARNATNCALVCVHGGAGFALVVDDKIYLLDGDLTVLKKMAGQRAQVTGVQHGNTITFSSVVPES